MTEPETAVPCSWCGTLWPREALLVACEDEPELVCPQCVDDMQESESYAHERDCCSSFCRRCIPDAF